MTQQDDPWNDELQSLLQEVDAADSPPADMKARILERVEASLSQAPSSAEASTTTATISKALSPWTVIGIAAVGVVAIVTISEPEDEPAPLERRTTVAQTTTASANQPTKHAVNNPLVPETTPTPSTLDSKSSDKTPTDSEPQPSLTPNVEPSKIAGAPSTDESPSPEPTPQPTTEPSKPRADLRAEQALLEKARAAIDSGRTQRAWKHLRKHAKKYPRGVLVEERELLWVRGLMRAGKKKRAARRAKRFLKRFPRSSQRLKVEEALID